MANQEPGFVRVTISIPRNLKKRMEAYTGGAVWSHIAAQAFTSYLREVAPTDRERQAKEFWEKHIEDMNASLNRIQTILAEFPPA